MQVIYLLNIKDLNIEKYIGYATEERQEKVNRKTDKKAKAQSLGVELLLFYALKKMGFTNVLPRFYKYGENGKPKIEGIEFNLSHSGNYAVAAVGKCPLGIDIQIKKNLIPIARKLLTDSEKETFLALKDAQKNDYLLETFVRKESIQKLDGSGISKAFSKINAYESKEMTVFRKLFYGNYYLALSVYGKIDKVKVEQVDIDEIERELN